MQNPPNLGLIYAEFAGNVSLFPSGTDRSNFENLCFRQLCHAVLNAFGTLDIGARSENAIRVKHIFRACQDFQITQHIVCLFSVLVIHIMAFRDWPNECFNHKPMNRAVFPNTVTMEHQRKIARRSDKMRLENMLSGSAERSRAPLNATAVAHFIESLVTHDWLPNLVSFHQGIITCL
jgi:hypothetical protein